MLCSINYRVWALTPPPLIEDDPRTGDQNIGLGVDFDCMVIYHTFIRVSRAIKCLKSFAPDTTGRDVVLGTCNCTRVQLEYRFQVLVLVLVLEG